MRFIFFHLSFRPQGLRGRVPVSVRVLTSVSTCVVGLDESQILRIFRERNSLLMFGVDLCEKTPNNEEEEETTPSVDIKGILKDKSESLKTIVSEAGCKSKLENLNLGFISFFSFIERFVLKTHQKSLPRSMASKPTKLLFTSLSQLKLHLYFYYEPYSYLLYCFPYLFSVNYLKYNFFKNQKSYTIVFNHSFTLSQLKRSRRAHRRWFSFSSKHSNAELCFSMRTI